MTADSTDLVIVRIRFHVRIDVAFSIALLIPENINPSGGTIGCAHPNAQVVGIDGGLACGMKGKHRPRPTESAAASRGAFRYESP